MEKTKKLFAYVVVFVAIICLFAGVAVQSNLANAAGSPQVSVDKVYDVNGNELAENAVVVSVPSESSERTALTNEKSNIEKGQISDNLKTALTAIAKKSDAEANYQAMVYGDPMKVTLTGVEEAVVSFDLSRYAKPVSFILFKGVNAANWIVIEPEAAAANGAANAAGDSVSFKIPGSGTVIFGGFSQSKANEIKAQEAKAEPCCKCCSENCPFCSFLCKDGKCYCWTMYVVIALAVVFVVLIIALIVVKSKTKKKAAAKAVAATEPVEEKKEDKPKK
ncbi:MAG: hypothetical protein J5781_01170 [Clostridia bacterium]|nr:hypothetical protein [Clostridia bacterium]